MAGTITQVGNILETRDRTIITLLATGDASDGSVPAYSIPKGATANKFLLLVTTKPGTYGSLPLPFTMTVKDADGSTVAYVPKRSTVSKQYFRCPLHLGTYPPAEICSTLNLSAVGKSRKSTIELVFVALIPETAKSLSESSESSLSYDSASSQSSSSSSVSQSSSSISESSSSDSSESSTSSVSSVSSESSTSSTSSVSSESSESSTSSESIP